MNNEFKEALQTHNLKKVKELVGKIKHINELDITNGYSYLHYAVISQYQETAEIVQILLDKKIDTEIKEKFSQFTPLLMATYNGHYNIVRMLVENGADIHAIDKDNNNPFLWASFNGFYDITKLLLEHGADYNIQDNPGYTALMWAVSNSSEKMVDLILGYKPNLNVQNNDKYTALYMAAREQNKKIFKKLLMLGADPTITNKKDQTLIEDCSSYIRDELRNYDTQKHIIDNYPKLYEEFKKEKLLHPDIIQDFGWADAGNGLGLF